MAWFKKILTKVVKSKFGKVMDTFSAAFSSPVSAIKAAVTTKTFAEVTKEHFEKPLATQISKTVVSTAMYAGAVYGAGVIAAKGIGAAAVSLIPATLKGKVIAGVVTPFAAAYVIKKPEVIEKIAEVPATAWEAGLLAAEPTLKDGIAFVKEHPYMSAAAIAAALAGMGYGAVMIAKIVGYVKKPKEEIIEAPVIIPTEPAPEKQLIPEKAVGVEEAPILPETTTITTGKKPYKRRRAKITPSVKQSVRINIISRPVATGLRILNKRYINQEVLA